MTGSKSPARAEVFVGGIAGAILDRKDVCRTICLITIRGKRFSSPGNRILQMFMGGHDECHARPHFLQTNRLHQRGFSLSGRSLLFSEARQDEHSPVLC